jgi:CTP:molybdopterin cytidylyltransferase MocA
MVDPPSRDDPRVQANHPSPVNDAPRVGGLVLAGGAGTRFGGPKALAMTADGTPWLRLAVELLRAGGCDPVWIALGAEAERAATLAPDGVMIVRARGWAQGLSATLAAGLASARGDGDAGDAGVDAIVITPVDTPDAPASAVARIVSAAGDRPRARLIQATYGGRPGHPVLVGADHFAALERTLTGDRGARPYLVAHHVLEIECADLWSGEDIDGTPPRQAP